MSSLPGVDDSCARAFLTLLSPAWGIALGLSHSYQCVWKEHVSSLPGVDDSCARAFLTLLSPAWETAIGLSHSHLCVCEAGACVLAAWR